VAFSGLIRRYGWPFRNNIALIVLLTTAANAFALASPAIIAAALTVFRVAQGTTSGGGGGGDLNLNDLGQRLITGLALPAAERPWFVVGLLAVAYLAQACGAAGLNYVAERVTLKIRIEATRLIRMDLLRHLFSLPLSFFHREKSGELLSRVTQDAKNVGQGVGPLIRRQIQQSIQVIGFGAYLVSTDAWLTVVAVGVVASHFALSHFLGHRLRLGSRQAVDRQAGLSAALQESLGAVRVAKSFGAERYELARLERSVSKVADANLVEGRVNIVAEPVRLVLDALATFTIFVFAAIQLRAGFLTIQGLLLYVYVGRLLIAPVNRMATDYLWMQWILASFDRITELLTIRSPLVDGPETTNVFERSIELKSVTFSYGSHRVLDDVSLDIRKGESVALVGQSGAGKSTLTDLILRLHDPDAGEVLMDGVNIRCFAQASYRRPFGVVSQENLLFHDTVSNNIRYGRDGITDEAIVRAAKIANAHDFIIRLQRGYDTVVGDRGLRLSGGERQRVAIARAVVHQPEILILDEATSALDSESERLVQEAIERVTQSVTTLIVAHRLSTVRYADKIVVMERGQIVDCGRHDELLGRCAVYVQLCGLQFGVPQPELLEGSV